MTKVLHIITRLDKGGSAENTLLTCIGLNKKIYEVALVSGLVFSLREEEQEEAEREGVNFIVIPELIRSINLLKDIKTFWKIFRLLKKEKFDIVHTHSSKAGILGRLAAKLAGVPIIVHTPHGHIFYGYFNFFLSKIFIVLERFVAKFTNKIITLTEKGREEHIKFKIAPSDKFIAIHSGIRFNSLLPIYIDVEAKRKQLGIPQDSLVVGTVGRLVPVKGQRYLIEAVARLVNVMPNLILLVVGNGPLKKDLEIQVKRLKINARVRFLGLRDDIPELLSILDLFVLPSINEGMGRALVVAMALGKPVVAARVGGIPDVVIDGQTGLLVQPKDPAALAEAMLKLLKDKPLAKKMGEQGKIWVVPRFDAEAMVNKIKGLYEDLLKNYKGGFLN